MDPLELRGGVTGSLFFDDGDVLSFFLALGLDDTDGLAVDKEDVVGGAGVGLIFADGLALAFVMVPLAFVLDDPTRGAELRVDLVARDLLWVLVKVIHC